MMEVPDISVVIPTIRGREDSLLRAIGSINEQNLTIEVLIVSTDTDIGHEDLISRFPSLQCRLITHTGKGNAAGNRNQGLAQARGRFVSFLDDDDEFLSRKLEIQLRAMSASGVRWSFSNYYLCLATSPSTAQVFSARSMIRRNLDFAKNCAIATPTVMVERGLLQQYDLRFDDSLTSREDIKLWQQLLERTPALYIPAPLAKVNRGDNAAFETELASLDKPSCPTRAIQWAAAKQRRVCDRIDLRIGRFLIVQSQTDTQNLKDQNLSGDTKYNMLDREPPNAAGQN